MRAHALVLLVLVALVAPAAPATGGRTSSTIAATNGAIDNLDANDGLTASSIGSTDSLLERGRELSRRGEYAQAEQFYADTAAQAPDLAPRALLLQARASLADGDSATAESIVQELLNDYPTSDQVAGAYFTLEQIRRAAGNCSGALRALDAFEATAGQGAIGPYAALQRAQCSATLGDWPGELAAARAALGIDGGGPRLTQIEALERAAEAQLKMGRKQEALDFYNQSLALAGTRGYTAEMLFTTATMARALGQSGLAADRFRAIVVDYADQARAPGALDALVEMGLGGTVSPLQAGIARFNAHDYSAAIAQFDQVEPMSDDWGSAQVNRAEALLKLGNEAAAREGLVAVAESADLPAAGKALLRLGQLDERNGNESQAEQRYLDTAQVAPDRTAEAMFHIGFTRYVRGDRDGAMEAWQLGQASGPPAPALQAQLQYWVAKARPIGSADATDGLNRAAAAAPESYYGLRAQELLNGSLTMAALAPTSNAWLALSSNDLQERSAWFRALGTTPERVAQEVSALPSMRRADTLLDLGLRTEASWEIEGVVQHYAQAKDIAHMSAVADWIAARDEPQLTLYIGKQMRDLVGLNGLPRALQKYVYPAAWGDIVAEQAAAYGVDPLLMLALMRQESSFDPRAQSGAQAMGLTQIIPSTARNIAARLARDDFALRDLFKPEVSVEFGTWYLSQLLAEYQGRVFPTLAAYDAGGGNVARWLQRYGDDPDLLVEQIPFAETQTYLRIVYDNYWHYRALYAGTP
jgi:soluble lytic murein transglycosylase